MARSQRTLRFATTGTFVESRRRKSARQLRLIRACPRTQNVKKPSMDDARTCTASRNRKPHHAQKGAPLSESERVGLEVGHGWKLYAGTAQNIASWNDDAETIPMVRWGLHALIYIWCYRDTDPPIHHAPNMFGRLCPHGATETGHFSNNMVVC